MIPTIILFVVIAGLCLKFGKKDIASAILGFYPAVALVNDIPWYTPTTKLSALIAFVVVWILSVICIRRIISVNMGYGSGRKYTTAGLMALGLTLQIMLTLREIAPVELPFTFTSPITDFLVKLPWGLLLFIPVATIFAADKE